MGRSRSPLFQEEKNPRPVAGRNRSPFFQEGQNPPRCGAQLLFHKHADQFVPQLAVRRIAHRQIHPGGFVHNAFLMGESVKAPLAVVGPHAALAHAAKAHSAGGQMCIRDSP